MKVGDLVRYFNSAYPSRLVGVILEIDKEGGREYGGSLDAALSPYRVRWLDHTESMRDWYGEQELAKL